MWPSWRRDRGLYPYCCGIVGSWILTVKDIWEETNTKWVWPWRRLTAKEGVSWASWLLLQVTVLKAMGAEVVIGTKQDRGWMTGWMTEVACGPCTLVAIKSCPSCTPSLWLPSIFLLLLSVSLNPGVTLCGWQYVKIQLFLSSHGPQFNKDHWSLPSCLQTVGPSVLNNLLFSVQHAACKLLLRTSIFSVSYSDVSSCLQPALS